MRTSERPSQVFGHLDYKQTKVQRVEARENPTKGIWDQVTPLLPRTSLRHGRPSLSTHAGSLVTVSPRRE